MRWCADVLRSQHPPTAMPFMTPSLLMAARRTGTPPLRPASMSFAFLLRSMRALLAMASAVVMNGLVTGSSPLPPERIPVCCTYALHHAADLNSSATLLRSLGNWHVKSMRICRQAFARSFCLLSAPVRAAAWPAHSRMRRTSAWSRPCSVPSSTSLSTAQPARRASSYSRSRSSLKTLPAEQQRARRGWLRVLRPLRRWALARL